MPQMEYWDYTGARVRRAREALAGKREGVDYIVLAYTDWADEFVPTIVQWKTGPKAGQTDSFSEGLGKPKQPPVQCSYCEKTFKGKDRYERRSAHEEAHELIAAYRRE